MTFDTPTLDPEADFKVFMPEGHTEPPTTVLEALWRVMAMLRREACWVKGAWFHNPGAREDPEDPFCNSWHACLQGMIGLATIGAVRHLPRHADDREAYENPWLFEFNYPTNPETDWAAYSAAYPGMVEPPRWRLYAETVTWVNARLPLVDDESRFAATGKYTSIPSYNDDVLRSRTQVLQFVDECIVDAQSATFVDGGSVTGTPLT